MLLLGENLFLTSDDSLDPLALASGAISSWYGEISLYKYPRNETEKYNQCSDWTKVGHFTQVSHFSQSLDEPLHKNLRIPCSSLQFRADSVSRMQKRTRNPEIPARFVYGECIPSERILQESPFSFPVFVFLVN